MPSAENVVPPLIRRFTTVQILAHLLLAACFLAMLVTGVLLFAPTLSEVLGRPLSKAIHLWSSGILLAGLAGLALMRPREMGRVMREADSLDRADRAWLRGGLRRLVDHRGAPEQGWLNAGQKLSTMVMLGLMTVLYATGLVMWLGTGTTWLRIGSGAVDVHDLATILLTLLVLGHLYLALLNRGTRPALRGIVTGHVDREWARANHGRWVRELERGTAEGTTRDERGIY